MQEDEVSSLITSEIEEIEDESLRSFVAAIIQHERENLDDKYAEYMDKYIHLIETHADDKSLNDIESD